MSTNTNSNSDQIIEETKVQTKPEENLLDPDKKDETKSSDSDYALAKPRRRKIRGSLFNDQSGQSTVK